MKKLKLAKPSIGFYLRLFVTNMVLWFALNASAQNNISGRVLNDSTEVLQAATVTNKNSNQSVVTGNNGEFSIAAKPGDVLEASAVGYINQQLTIKANEAISFVLQSGSSKLDEVLVVGYNTQSRRNIIGSVASVTGAEINKRVQTNPATLLQGKLPGLQVVQNSG